MPNDTDPQFAEMYRRKLLAKSPGERVKLGCSMHQTAKEIALLSLRAANPHATDAELRGLLFLRFYGDDFPPEQRDEIYYRLVKGSTS